eukprot:178030-Chlamydomonas_euryale.AAC.15
MMVLDVPMELRIEATGCWLCCCVQHIPPGPDTLMAEDTENEAGEFMHVQSACACMRYLS